MTDHLRVAVFFFFESLKSASQLLHMFASLSLSFGVSAAVASLTAATSKAESARSARKTFREAPRPKTNRDARLSAQQRGARRSQRSVCVFRARSMTEQQEQSEEPGLVSTQDLDPSKDDDGHFRQISHTRTHIHIQTPTRHLHPVHSHGFQPQEIHSFGTFLVLLFELHLLTSNSESHDSRDNFLLEDTFITVYVLEATSE